MRWWDVGRHWGTTPAERERPYPCDAVLSDANDAYYRGIDVAAPPETVFRWLCQLRAAPYSYDWIDNFGRRSPRELTPGLDRLEIGQGVMSIFELVSFERDVHLTMALRRPGLFPPLAVSYCVEPTPSGGTRLLAKLTLRLGSGLYHRAVGLLLPWGDWVMMRKQFLTLKRYAEASASS